MSQKSVVASSSEMESGKRHSKLTAKALYSKIEKLQSERKISVNKIKRFIPQIKSFMKKKENVSLVQSLLESLTEQCGNATKSHNMLIPLLPEEEQRKHNEWFSSIMGYSNTFQRDVEQWLNEPEKLLVLHDQDSGEMNEQVFLPAPEETQLQAASIINTDDLQDNVKPNDSVSNVGSRASKSQNSATGRESVASSIASARLRAEADLAALRMRQKLLKDKHELEEEGERIRKKKEQLKLDEEIAANMAKLNVLKSRSILSGKTSVSKRSDGMNSYLEKGQGKTQTLSAKAKSFAPQSSQHEYNYIHLDAGSRPKEKNPSQLIHSYESNLYAVNHSTQEGMQMQDGNALNVNIGPNEDQSNMFGIMSKQNEITSLLVQQQCLSSLPKREIPIFDGDPLKYHAFVKAFENGVERNTANHSDRLYFLEQHTRGHSKELIGSCQHMEPERGYAKAKALLKEQFGNEQRISYAYMEKALSWPSIKNEDVKALRDYSLFLRGCCNVMEEVQYLHELNIPANMLTIIKKLPYKFRDKWRSAACELQERHSRRATLIDITNFIERQVRILTDPVFGNIQDAPSLMTNRGVNKANPQTRSAIKGTSFATTVAPAINRTQPGTKGKEHIESARRTCICCGEGHALNSCPQLGKKTHKEKIGFLREKSVCFGCLCIGHISKVCRKRITCTKCGLKHPTVLHIPQKEKDKDSDQAERKSEVSVDSALMSSGLTGAGDHDCKLPIVPVQVKSKKGSKIVTTYAFLDPGSTAVFCTEALREKLNIAGKKVHILLRTMGQEKVVSSHMVPGLEVAGLTGEHFCELPKAYTQAHMPVHKGNIPKQSDIQKWPYLKHVHLPEIDAGIELLIGTNVAKALEPLQVIRSVGDGPYAIRTMLGWTVNGPLREDNDDAVDGEQPELTVNRVSVVTLDELWQQQFKTDFPECSLEEGPGMSREEQKFMKLVANSAKQVSGHYQINLPLRNKDVSMPNNRKIIEQRALHLKKRLQKDSSFHADYKAFMNDLVVKGYAERVPEEDLERSDGRVWYIPHQGVYHPTKKKIRVVFDCGASFQGTSLNAQLLQGPDLTSSLIGVMSRFRKEPVVIMADVEAMFHQVRVPPEDADLLRFLWWPAGDLSQDHVDFRMLVHLFGATSSPSCANFALRKCAEDNKGQFSQEAMDKVLHSFYVDDCLVSVASEEKAVSLYHELIAICAKGGFRLTKWISNRRDVLTAIPEEHRAKDMKMLNMDQDLPPVERVLGVEWCIQSDTFKFKIVVKDRPLTRRGILSTVSSIYDPLGIVSPVVLSAKKILRDLCRRALGWDDVIPQTVAQEWTSWLDELFHLEKCNIMRCLKPLDFGEVTTAQLHHFCDASEDGYGAVTYLLSRNAHSQVHSAFVMGKARVAPLKPATIPRMELIAATMASRIDILWKKELHMHLQDSVFWTDSTSVLKYIRNETSRFRVFVANRVTEIRKASQPSQWRYVGTASNPADVASRGVKGDAFLKDATWVSGPRFLLQPENEWPVNPENVHRLPADDPEVKKEATVNTVQASEEADAVTRMIHHFSSWIHLRKSVAWILRFKTWLLSLCQKRRQLNMALAQSALDMEQQRRSLERDMETFKRKMLSSCLSVEELEKSELEIIKFSQRRRFPEEFSMLEKGKSVKGHSHIHTLCPLIKDGVLRLGGRLSRSSMPAEAKHPIILAKDLHISTLLLRHVHQEVGHSGRNHMLSKLREKYWISGASTAIRSVLSKCLSCRRLNAQPVSQLMADLPSERVIPDEPPFTRVGVDYFGPFEVRSRRSVVKRYGVIFTCMALRAIHIEVAPSLDTDAFINALRRFIARRGQVRELRSDNGTNFRGAEHELKTSIEQWNQAQINDVLLQKGIKWTFNPPAGSHHGGSWERLIRSVRKVLNSTLNVQSLDEEGLHTVLCEVEAIINGRPITKASMDPHCLEALTPNHLLLLKALPSLPPGVFQEADMYARRRWKQVQYMSDLFWKRWVKEYLPQLQERQRWSGVKRNLVPGDLVLIVDSTAPRNSWVIGRVLQTFPDRRGFVRQVRIKTKSSCLNRPITKVCLLQEADAGCGEAVRDDNT